MADLTHTVRPVLGDSAVPSRDSDMLPRVVDIRAWHDGSGMRRVRPPRALWARSPATHRDAATPETRLTSGPVDVPRHVPVSAAPDRSTLRADGITAGPVLLVTCAESRVVEQLRPRLPVVSVLQNLGGVMPRSPQAPRMQTDVATVDAALDQHGARHIVCVGHLGCRVPAALARGASPVPVDAVASRQRQVREVEHHVFTQMQRVRAFLKRRTTRPSMRVTGLWVDELTGHVHAFDPGRRRFAPLDALDLVRYAAAVPGRGGRADQEA